MREDDDKKENRKCERSPSLEALRGERLAARIEELCELRAFMHATRTTDDSNGIEHAEASIKAACIAQKEGNCQVAWRHCHQAYRFLLAGMNDEERESRRRALRREAEEKLKNWRRDAVLDIIGRDVKADEISAAELSTAQFIMDEHFGNMYFKLEATAIGLRIVPWVMGSLTLILILIAIILHMLETVDSTFVLFDLHATFVVLAAGAVGATLSNTLSVLGYSGRIPAYLGQAGSWTVRLPLGALSAFAVVAVIQSGLLPFTEMEEPGIYGWAVAAGFSDQLLNQVMRRVEKAAEE